MAAKRRKKHKNLISGLVFSMCYNVLQWTKIEILNFYEFIRFRLLKIIVPFWHISFWRCSFGILLRFNAVFTAELSEIAEMLFFTFWWPTFNSLRFNGHPSISALLSPPRFLADQQKERRQINSAPSASRVQRAVKLYKP